MRLPAEHVAQFGALTLLTFGAATTPNTLAMLAAVDPRWTAPVALVTYCGSVTMVAFLATFPDGRFVPPATRVLVLVWAVLLVPGSFLPAGTVDAGIAGTIAAVLYFGLLPALVLTQIYRYRRVSNVVQRQQTRLVVAGLIATFGGLIAVLVVGVLLPRPIDVLGRPVYPRVRSPSRTRRSAGLSWRSSGS